MGTRQKQQQQRQVIFIIPSVRFVQKNYQPQTISMAGIIHSSIVTYTLADSRHRCTCWRLLLLQCITGFLPIAWVKSELSLSLILKCLSGFFLIITQAILTSFWLEEFRFCTTECEMTFPAISSLASGHFRLPSAVFPFRAASEILKLPKVSLQQCLRVAAACRQRFWTPFESNH